MIRLLLRLFKITDFETCKSCETLKQQLDLANEEKRELMETLIQLTRPNVIVPSGEAKVLENVPFVKANFGRRRAVLEEMHRKKDNILRSSPFVAQPSVPVQHITPQSVEDLEAKLGIVDEDGEEGKSDVG